MYVNYGAVVILKYGVVVNTVCKLQGREAAICNYRAVMIAVCKLQDRSDF